MRGVTTHMKLIDSKEHWVAQTQDAGYAVGAVVGSGPTEVAALMDLVNLLAARLKEQRVETDKWKTETGMARDRIAEVLSMMKEPEW